MGDETIQELRKLALGSKIRTLRERQRLTLEQVSTATQIPAVVLSQIEDDVISPTVAALVRLSGALATTVDALLQDAPFSDRVEVTRHGEGRRILRRSQPEGTSLTYNYESLAYRLPGKHMEPFLVEFALDAEAPARPVTHVGEEFLYILEGEVEFLSGDERLILRAGDSIYFYSSAPHALRAVGTVTPRAIAVLYPYAS